MAEVKPQTPSAGGPRVLYVRTEGRGGPTRESRLRAEAAGEAPRRAMIEDLFGFDLLGESDLAVLGGLRGRLLRALPAFVALALEVDRRRRDYDVVVSWAEKYSVGIGAVFALRRRRPRHMAIMDWISKPVVRLPLRLVRRGVDLVTTWSSVQGRYAVDTIGFDARQVRYLQHPVDDVFFSPIETGREGLFSAGETQRDFATLIEAAAALDVPTLIAASKIGVFNGVRTTLKDAEGSFALPSQVRIEALDPVRLRRGYAAARVVVVPLVEADNNAGISVLLEAMAMARPVVVTRTRGQVDVVRDGVTGVYVAPGDAAGLREAIEDLLAHPDRAEQMGRRARDQILARNRADVFAREVRSAAVSLLDGAR
jgi:glycosyltransferase involved in cell wall biosynthesis